MSPTMTEAPTWMTLSRASNYLGVAQATIRRWTDSGQLPSFKTPGGHRRFRQEDLDKFMSTAQGSELPESRYGGLPHVLVVDDDTGIRQMIADCLLAEGFAVDQAVDARDGIMRIRERIPDLILLDVKMPGM